MNIDLAIAELERSPDLIDHVARLHEFIQDEQRRREQFYQDLDEDTKAEFIHGEVVAHSPARVEHLEVSFFTTNLLGNFVVSRDLGRVYSEKCLVQCRRNAYEPDICFFAAPKVAAFVAGQKIFPPPDLIVEILSPSTTTNDRTVKQLDYARHGVAEYWIIDADDRIVEQYVLPPGTERYTLKARLTEGARLASVAIPGFDVPVAALFDASENQRALAALHAPQ